MIFVILGVFLALMLIFVACRQAENKLCSDAVVVYSDEGGSLINFCNSRDSDFCWVEKQFEKGSLLSVFDPKKVESAEKNIYLYLSRNRFRKMFEKTYQLYQGLYCKENRERKCTVVSVIDAHKCVAFDEEACKPVVLYHVPQDVAKRGCVVNYDKLLLSPSAKVVEVR